jgi:hypothetical protein
MTRATNLVLGLVFILAAPPLVAQDGAGRSISVSGTAETKTAPDLIVWRVNLSDADKNLTTAKVQSDTKVRSVLALRVKLGIGEGDLETGHVSVRREYERDQHGQRGDFKHFVVSRSVTIRQRDLKRFDEILDALVSSAEMEVDFSFESSRIHEVRTETRLRAVRAAKDKAAAMVEAVGAELGRVLTLNEHRQGDQWRSRMSNNLSFVDSTPSVDVASETFLPGAIVERITVYASFEIK